MADWVQTKYHNDLLLGGDRPSVFKYLSDFEHSVPQCFEGLSRFSLMEGSVFEWVFKELRYQTYALTIHFATRFELLPDSEIRIHAVPDIGNSQLSGGWKLEAQSTGTLLHFHVAMKVALKLPLLLRALAVPILERELSNYFDRYLENVQKHFK